jgi:hypothetical protein
MMPARSSDLRIRPPARQPRAIEGSPRLRATYPCPLDNGSSIRAIQAARITTGTTTTMIERRKPPGDQLPASWEIS